VNKFDLVITHFQAFHEESGCQPSMRNCILCAVDEIITSAKEPSEAELDAAAEKYYWKHQEIYAASPEQSWLKDVVKACFQDGVRWRSTVSGEEPAE
jgi:hypothetical protein